MWITQAACYSYQTRLGTSNALIRLAHLLIQRARQLYKFESDLNVSYLGAQFPSLKASHVDWNSPKEVKVCPGKGVSVTFCRPRNDGGTNLTHDSTIVCEAAVGSLDYITANHCYGLKEETHEERGKLQNRFQAWAQHRLTNGDDVVFLAVNGFPLGKTIPPDITHADEHVDCMHVFFSCLDFVVLVVLTFTWLQTNVV